MTRDSPRAHWDARYRDQTVGGAVPFVDEVLSLLPRSGRALDLAGGSGGTALALADHGLEVTLADISSVALDLARSAAASRGLDLHTIALDLETDPPPAGPWDVVVCANYLNRPLLSELDDLVGVGGLAAVIIATTTNLERNDRPSRRFLVEPGELQAMLERFEPVVANEGWFDGRHEARFLGRLCR